MSAKHPPGPSASQTSGTGGSSSNQRVEVTVLKAHNLSNVKVWLRKRRRFFVTITNQSETLRSESTGIRIDPDGETVEWKQKLGVISVQQTSPLKLRLYAKRFLFPDTLIGAHELRLPVEFARDISLDLRKGSRQPVTLHVAVTLPIDPTKSIAPGVGNPPPARPIVPPPSPETSRTPATVSVSTERLHVQTDATGGSSTEGVHDSANVPNEIETPQSGVEAGAAVTMSASTTPSPIDSTKSFAPEVGNLPTARPIVLPPAPVTSRAAVTATASTEPLHVPTDASVSSQTDATGGSSIEGVHDSANVPNEIETPKSGVEAGTASTMSAGTTPSPIDPTKSIAPEVGNPSPIVLPPSPVTSRATTVNGIGTLENGISDLSTPVTSEPEKTINDINDTTGQFRILVIGRSGVGKSSMINCVFGIDAASVEDYTSGEADIQKELVSPKNRFFVLHDSKGFEPGDLSNFETVREFIEQRLQPQLPMKERIHGLWLCTETPAAGGRIFETGDEQLLEFAHKKDVPLLVVFTQYDRVVRTKEAKLRKDKKDPTLFREQSREEAKKTFEGAVQLLQDTATHFKIPVPRYVKASVRPGYKEDVSELVKVTEDMVKEKAKR